MGETGLIREKLKRTEIEVRDLQNQVGFIRRSSQSFVFLIES